MKKNCIFILLFISMFVLSCDNDCINELTIVDFKVKLNMTSFYLGEYVDDKISLSAYIVDSNGKVMSATNYTLFDIEENNFLEDVEAEKRKTFSDLFMFQLYKFIDMEPNFEPRAFFFRCKPSYSYYNNKFENPYLYDTCPIEVKIPKTIDKVRLLVSDNSCYLQGYSLQGCLSINALGYAVYCRFDGNNEDHRINNDSQYLTISGVDETTPCGLAYLTATYCGFSSTPVPITVIDQENLPSYNVIFYQEDGITKITTINVKEGKTINENEFPNYEKAGFKVRWKYNDVVYSKTELLKMNINDNMIIIADLTTD